MTGVRVKGPVRFHAEESKSKEKTSQLRRVSVGWCVSTFATSGVLQLGVCLLWGAAERNVGR